MHEHKLKSTHAQLLSAVLSIWCMDKIVTLVLKPGCQNSPWLTLHHKQQEIFSHIMDEQALY